MFIMHRYFLKQWLAHGALTSLYLLRTLSGHYDEVVDPDGTTQGEAILERFGFVFKGEPFEHVW